MDQDNLHNMDGSSSDMTANTEQPSTEISPNNVSIDSGNTDNVGVINKEVNDKPSKVATVFFDNLFSDWRIGFFD